MSFDTESNPAARRRNGKAPRVHAGRLSRRERVVLDLLAGGGEMAGLELVVASPKLGRGTVYVTLRRLADKGLVDSRRAGRGREMPLRLFRATGGETATC